MKSRVNNDLSAVSQMALQVTVHSMVDGLGLAHALQLAVAGLTTECAAILRLRMAGRIVKAKRPRRATRKLVQVWLVYTNKLESFSRCLLMSNRAGSPMFT